MPTATTRRVPSTHGSGEPPFEVVGGVAPGGVVPGGYAPWVG
jgi:hypothetical protein